MLYTRKGDNGTTKKFGCDQRISKSSAVAEALGALDEVNSYLGICKVKSKKENLILPNNMEVYMIIHDVQENLFIIQSEIAGTKKNIKKEKIIELEIIIDEIEKELPKIKSFFISGGTKIGAMFDFARTLARLAERRVVAVDEEKIEKVGEFTKAYLNRLSSLLYALARHTNHISGIKEESPSYK